MGRVTGTTIFTADGKRNVKLEETFSAILGAKQGEYFYADNDGNVQKTYFVLLLYVLILLLLCVTFCAYDAALIVTSGGLCEKSDGRHGLYLNRECQ